MRCLQLVALAGGLLSLNGCGDGQNPAAPGPGLFKVTIDGSAWVQDRALCGVHALTTGDTLVTITASRLDPVQGRQVLGISFDGFPAQGELSLGGSIGSEPAQASFFVFGVNSGPMDPPLAYEPRYLHPGLLSITDVIRPDGVVSGTFSFEAATFPDTMPHRLFAGEFSLLCLAF